MIGQSVGSDASPLSCFLFRPRKSRKSAGNAVIPTFPMHWPHGLQDLRHKRRNARFKGAWRVHTPPHLLTAHTAAHRAKHGAFWMGALSLPSERFARFGNPARPGVRTAYFAAFGPWSGVFPKNAESLRNSDALMRVAVPRRRSPAGLRDPIAVSLAALMGFAVLLSRFVGTQKIERLFFSYSGAFFEPLFASIHARNLSLGTTIRLPILSAGNPLPCTSS